MAVKYPFLREKASLQINRPLPLSRFARVRVCLKQRPITSDNVQAGETLSVEWIKPSPTRYDHRCQTFPFPAVCRFVRILPGVFTFIFQFPTFQAWAITIFLYTHMHIYISMEMEMEMNSSGSPVPMAYLAATMNETSSCLSI